MSTIDKAEEQALGGHHKFGTTLRHASVDERLNAGKQARSTVPRSSHAALPAAGDRPDPVTLLEEQAASRVQSLVPIRYGRMLSSPFAFYRGAARIMASDLAGTPDSGLHVQLCGDAHLSNFGMFASPERRLVFGLNDFDETLPGPWEWDVKRLAASVEVAGRENGYTDKERTRDRCEGRWPATAVRLREFATMTNLDVWYSRQEVGEVVETASQSQLDPKRLKVLEKNLSKTRTRDSMHAFSKLTEVVDGEPRIISAPPLIQPARDILARRPGEAVMDSCARSCAIYRESLQSDRRVCWSSFGSWTSRSRWWVWAASARRAWIVLLMGKDGDRSAVPAVQGGTGLGAGRVPPAERVRHPQPAGGGRAAPDADVSSDIFLGWLHAQSNLDGQHETSTAAS